MTTLNTKEVLEKFENETSEEFFDFVYKKYFEESTESALKSLSKQEVLEIFQPDLVKTNLKQAFDLLRQYSILFLKPGSEEAIRNFYLSFDQENRSHPSLEDACGISEDTINEVFCLGRNLYQEKRYQEAESLFYLLSIFSPFRANVYFALGLCKQAEGNFKNAIECYRCARIIDPDDLSPGLSMMECFLHEKDISSAKEIIKELEPVVQRSSNDALKDRFIKLKNLAL